MKAPKCLKLLIPSFLLFLSSLSAQTATTDPVGFVQITIPSGLSMVSLPLQKVPFFTGLVTSVDNNVISANFGTLPNGFFYVQVIESSSSSNIGLISSVVNSGLNSVEVSPSLPLQQGDKIKIRSHFTFSDIVSEPELSDGSTITLYSGDGLRESFQYVSAATLGTATGVWADRNSEDASNVAILPSEGFVINNNSVESKITFAGAVSVDSLKVSFGNSFSILGSVSPTDNYTISSVFADLAIGSNITIYSMDGNLDIVNSYQVLSSEDLGLGTGKTYVRNNEIGDDDLIPLGIGVVVVAPPSSSFLIPASYVKTN